MIHSRLQVYTIIYTSQQIQPPIVRPTNPSALGNLTTSKAASDAKTLHTRSSWWNSTWSLGEKKTLRSFISICKQIYSHIYIYIYCSIIYVSYCLCYFVIYVVFNGKLPFTAIFTSNSFSWWIPMPSASGGNAWNQQMPALEVPITTTLSRWAEQNSIFQMFVSSWNVWKLHKDVETYGLFLFLPWERLWTGLPRTDTVLIRGDK